MPPEWSQHAATWLSWPFDDDLWEGQLEDVRREFTALVRVIATFEPVVINVRDDEAEADARARLGSAGVDADRLRYHRLPLNDAWFRDNGPIFVRDDNDRVALVDWRFNAWGGKYAPWDDDDRAPAAVARTLGMHRFVFDIVMEGGSLEVNGAGVCLTTRSCLLAPERNPELSAADLETTLHEALGVTEVVWLDGGLEGDHTDGHIDTIVRFTDDDTIVCAIEEDADDANHATTFANLEVLRAQRDAAGAAYRVVPLPLPERRMEHLGRRLAPSYANFYVGNGFVVVPQFDDARDEQALEVLRPLFPGRQVIGSSAVALITGGGAFHCVTQQQPAGAVAPPTTDAAQGAARAPDPAARAGGLKR